MPHKHFFKRTVRYKEIISIFIIFGFSDIISQIPILKNFKPLYSLAQKYHGKPLTEYTRYQRIRMMLEELGATFVKFGQILSNRHDILDKELIKELAKLQSEVKPFESEKVLEIIETELGDKAENIFSYFDETPSASASISQMHKAVLKSGESVAVKIKRPGIAEKVNTDVEILFDIAKLIEKHVPSLAVSSPISIVQAFKEQITKELSFAYEKNNIKRFYKYFENDKTVCIPKVYDEYTSQNILTLEYIDGIKISKIKNVPGVDVKVVTDRLVNAMLYQIFEHNFFHADPHPGNLFVIQNDVVAFIDFGMVGLITPSIKKSLVEMISAIYSEDYNRFSHAIINLTKKKEISDFESFNNKVYELIQKYISMTLEDIKLEEAFNEVIYIVHKYNLELDPYLVIMLKTAVILEGVGRYLDKDFKVIERISPFIKKYMQDRMKPTSVLKQLKTFFFDTQTTIRLMPAQINEALNTVKKGSMKIQFEHKGLEGLAAMLDSVANRLSYSIVLASIIISSGLIVHAKIPPFIFGDIPIIGMGGFLISAVMGFFLIATRIVRHFIKK